MKKCPEDFTKRCGHCNSVITISLTMRKATFALPGIGKYITVVSVNKRRGKHGDRWGVYTSVVWLCPKCDHVHDTRFFDPDNQADFFDIMGL